MLIFLLLRNPVISLNIFNFDSVLNKGERFSFTDVITQGSHYYASSVTLPVGYNGLSSTLRISKMMWQTITREVSQWCIEQQLNWMA